MKVVIQQADLDTCMTGVILNVGNQEQVKVAGRGANYIELADPRVLCIEAGGSGSVDLNNFDHHDPTTMLPPACRQALQRVGHAKNRHLINMVDYVCSVDEPSRNPCVRIEFPSLSNIFSGMRMVEKTPIAQFRRGIQELRFVLDHKIDPWQTMPDLPHWQPFRMAKQINQEKLNESLKDVRIVPTRKGLKLGVLETEAIGGLGLFYSRGCDIIVLHHPKFGFPPVSKFTICSKQISLNELLSFFQKLEQDWGGRQHIIGSPRRGTNLPLEFVVNLCKEFL